MPSKSLHSEYCKETVCVFKIVSHQEAFTCFLFLGVFLMNYELLNLCTLVVALYVPVQFISIATLYSIPRTLPPCTPHGWGQHCLPQQTQHSPESMSVTGWMGGEKVWVHALAAYLFLFIWRNNRERKNFSFAGLFLKFLQQLGMDQAKVRSQELLSAFFLWVAWT